MKKSSVLTPDEQKVVRAERIKRAYPKGTTVYTVVKKVSSNGMSRHIVPIVVVNGEARNISHLVSEILGWKWMDDGSIRVGGCGMDMGHHLVWKFGEAVHGDARVFEHQSL